MIANLQRNKEMVSRLASHRILRRSDASKRNQHALVDIKRCGVEDLVELSSDVVKYI